MVHMCIPDMTTVLELHVVAPGLGLGAPSKVLHWLKDFTMEKALVAKCKWSCPFKDEIPGLWQGHRDGGGAAPRKCILLHVSLLAYRTYSFHISEKCKSQLVFEMKIFSLKPHHNHLMPNKYKPIGPWNLHSITGLRYVSGGLKFLLNCYLSVW